MHERFDAFVHPTEALLQPHHVFAIGSEAKMARLDDARVHRTDGDFVETVTFNAAERIGFAFVGKILANVYVFQQRMIMGWPKLVQGQTTQIRMPGWHQSKQIMRSSGLYNVSSKIKRPSL